MSRKVLNKVPELVLHKCKAYINNKIKPDDVPTLIPSGALKEIQKNDSNPYYVIETIKDITKPANRVIFTENFWKGFINEMNHRPIPGGKYGHEISGYKRAGSDFYCVGGKIDGKKVHLKNYIPPQGDGSDNERFVQDCKIGIVHFSIVAYTKDEEDNETGEIKAIEFSHGARNDAVEYGTGAMQQKVNIEKMNGEGIKYNPYPNEHAARLRNPDDFADSATWQDGSTGRFRRTTVRSFRGKTSTKPIDVIWGKLPGRSGKNDPPIPQALRFKTSNWTATQAKKWLSDNEIKYISFEKATQGNKQNTGGKYIMPDNELKEILQNLNNQLDRGTINIKDIADNLKINIVKPEHTEALKTLSDIKQIVGDNPVKTIKQMKANEEEVKQTAFNNLREKLMSEKFGPEKIKHNGQEEINLVREAAEPHVKKVICLEEDLKKQIEAANENPVIKKLSQQIADYTSQENDITGIVGKKTNDNKDDFSSELVEM